MIPRRRFAASAFLLLAATVPARTAELEQVPVFVSGQDGYHTYRIPSLLVTGKGTLLAFCEGRKNSSSDSGDIDLLLKRSTDGGKTWGKTQVVWDDGTNTCGNPCPVLDARTGTVWLLLTHNLGSDTEERIVNETSKGTRTVWVTKSDDDGATWARPAEITRDVKKPNWTWYATGPGVGIRLKNGRLVVPCDNQVAGSKAQQAHVILSDDGGKTWKLGGIVGPRCDESQVVELRDGRLMLNIRSYRDNNRRLVAFSKDGGETFSDPVEDPALVEPVCQASILRHPGEQGGILFSNPASKKREKLTVRLSRDEGKTWPLAGVVHDGPSAYSCLAVLPDGTIACLYERGDRSAYETITCARLPLRSLRADRQEAGRDDAAAPALVIQNASVFDTATGTMTPNRTIVVSGEKIQAVGTPEQPAAAPKGAVVLDGKGKFVIPGLIDAHVHLVHRLNYAHMTGDEVLPLFLANGVTSVRDTGDEIVAQTLVARHADAHPAQSPRVFRASGLIDGSPPIHRDIGIPITDPALVPGLVEDMAGWDVTTLKIYAGTGRAVGRKVIEEGHRRGLVVTGHLSAYAAQDAVVDGIDCLEHIWSVFDFSIPPDVKKQPDHRATLDLENPQCRALVAMLARKKVLVDPTLTVFHNMLLLSDLEEVHRHADVERMPERLRTSWHKYRQGQGLAASTRDRRRQEFRKYQDLTGILHGAGVPLLAGTDSPEPYCPPGFALHQELELLVESGLTPSAALQAATVNNARSLKQVDRLGSIAPGKLADLVILTADPTVDIRNTRKIERVIRGGQVCDPQALLRTVPNR